MINAAKEKKATTGRGKSPRSSASKYPEAEIRVLEEENFHLNHAVNVLQNKIFDNKEKIEKLRGKGGA